MAAGSFHKVARDGIVRYHVFFDVPPGADGKRRRRTKSCKTRKEAQAVLSAWMVELRQGTLVERDERTVASIMAYWLETYASGLAPKTCEDYTRTVRLHIVPHLGATKVQALRPDHVLAWLMALRAAGIGRRTREVAHLRLKQALAQAVSLGIVPTNVAQSVTMPPDTTRNAQHAIWTEEEARTFLEVADRGWWYGPIWRVSLATGMRRGELLGLRWCDVDWTGGVLRIRQSVGILHSRPTVGPPKTPQSNRNVAVDPDVLSALREHRARQNEHRLASGTMWQDHDLVFPSKTGMPLHPSNLQREYSRLIRLAEVPYIRIHDQRHTHASWAIADGNDAKLVAERLGHKDIQMTLGRYTHPTPNAHRSLGERLGKKLHRDQGL